MSVDEPAADDAREGEGRYANHFTIGHNAFEFVLDFAQRFPEGRAVSRTRIITAPAYAKRLLAVLRDSIDAYERVFGPIGDEPPPV